MKRKSSSPVGIHIEGGKDSKLNQRVLSILDKALTQAITQGRETTACAIVEKIGVVGGVNGTVITGCSISQ